MDDRTLTCRTCGSAFVFTSGEQAFYAERGFHEPTRCPRCREGRRSERVAPVAASDRPLFAAVCSSCGRPTSVPFDPSPDRPVYCRSCFTARSANRAS